MKQLADALDPPLSRVPLPERELGIVAELGALGFVCFAIFAPRVELDGQVKKAKLAAGGVVAEAEAIAARHAGAPYATVTPLDELRRDGSAVDLSALAGDGITVGDTAPDLIVQADAAAREAGLTPETLVELRHEFGNDEPLLDSYPSAPTFENGEPLPRGIDGE